MKELICIGILIICACNQSPSKNNKDVISTHSEVILDVTAQENLFSRITSLNREGLLYNPKDSLVFLLLPMDASCAACRNKTIDSIGKYISLLNDRHFVIIASSSRRRINSYFEKRGTRSIHNTKNIFLDTTNQIFKSDLALENPVIYYASNMQVYRKVSCKPSTIKKDLEEFFSGL